MNDFKSKFILSTFLFLGVAFSQPKFNFILGTGYYNPKIETSDPIPKIGFVGKNLLLNWGMRYQIYPNVIIGYGQSHSLHFGTHLPDFEYTLLVYLHVLFD